jgi:triosephosphate isomerase
MNSLALFSLLAGSASAFTVSPSNNAAFYRPATDLYARKPFISGNWKLNPDTKEEAIALGKEIAAAVTDATGDIDVALFVPYVFIEAAKEAVGGKVSIGAEVCRREMTNNDGGYRSIFRQKNPFWPVAGI